MPDGSKSRDPPVSSGALYRRSTPRTRSSVAFGTLPGERLGRSAAPMAEVGAVYLPVGAAWFVTLGAVMAVATSLNVTMLAPSRVGIMLARDGLAPSWLGAIEPRIKQPSWAAGAR